MVKKKVTEDFEGGIDSLFSMVQAIDDSAEIIADSTLSNIKEWIPTGNYVLNACMSGDLFKAVPTGRIVSLCGSSGTGKSFLACSICREAQKMGYIPVYLDSEGAIDSDFVRRLGVDPTKLIIKKVNTIFETSQFIIKLCEQLQKQEEKHGAHDKIIIVLDSVGNLTSEKERDDTLTGNQKADFTKAKDLKALFRVCATPLAKLQCSLICVNHIYSCCLPGTKVMMADNTFKNIEDITKGEEVMTLNGPEEVTNSFSYKAPKYYELEFEDGYTVKCTLNHKFMVRTPDGDLIYKLADELTLDDEIVQI